MGKLTEAVDAHASRIGGTCTVGTWLATQTPAIRAEVAELVASDRAATAIVAGIEKHLKHRLSSGAMQRHRRGACLCPR
jgi:hypothetical protein